MAYEAEQFLEKHGIHGAIKGSSGQFSVPLTELSINSVKTRDFLTLNPPKWHNLEIDFARIFCQLGFDSFCWITKYTDPKIDFFAHAFEIKEVDFYLITGRMEGTITTRVENLSVCGIKEEVNVKTGEIRNSEIVTNSGNISGLVTDSITIVEGFREYIGQLVSSIKNLMPKTEIYIGGDFEKSGHIDLIKQILHYFLKGNIHVEDVVRMKISYEWFGERSAHREFKIDSNLPVRDVRWHLW